MKTRAHLAVWTLMCLPVVVSLASASWAAPQDPAAPAAADAHGSRLVTFHGTLKDADAHPRRGSALITFSLYTAQEGGEALWRESQVAAVDDRKRYCVLLGATTPAGLPPEVFGEGRAQWLGVQVAGEAEQPRVLLVAVPYALKAADADTLGGKPAASFVLSESLAKAIEEKVTAGIVSAQTVPTVGGGVAGPLGNEIGSNTWYGEYAGSKTTGGNNSFFGHSSGINNTTGGSNSFFGNLSGYHNETGVANSVFGDFAGVAFTSASRNAFFGALAGYSNTASENSFFGTEAGTSNTTGTGHAYFGYQAGYSNSTGSKNAFFGYQAGYLNSTASNNSFFGYHAGEANTTGYRNAFFGTDAGLANTSGDSNVFAGRAAGYNNTTGFHNTFVGHNAGSEITVEGGNTLIGSGTQGAAGVTNATAIGAQAQVTQSNSLVLGSIAGLNGAGADTRVGIGTTAPGSRLDVRGEVGSGDGTLKNVVSYARYLGQPVGVFGTMSSHDLQVWADGSPKLAVQAGGNVGIGTIAPLSALDVRGAVTSGDGTLQNVISYAAPGGPLVGVFGTLSSHDLQMWANGAPQITVTTAGNVGIGTSSPQYKLHVFGSIYATGTYLGSDRRLKRDVLDLRYGLREVMRLRPVSFGWNDPTLGSPTLGLIAQEAAPVVPELVARGQDQDGLLSLNYTGLVPVLVKAVQEQQATLAQKDAEIAALRAEMAALRAENTVRDGRLAVLQQQVERLLRADTR